MSQRTCPPFENYAAKHRQTAEDNRRHECRIPLSPDPSHRLSTPYASRCTLYAARRTPYVRTPGPTYTLRPWDSPQAVIPTSLRDKLRLNRARYRHLRLRIRPQRICQNHSDPVPQLVHILNRALNLGHDFLDCPRHTRRQLAYPIQVVHTSQISRTLQIPTHSPRAR